MVLNQLKLNEKLRSKTDHNSKINVATWVQRKCHRVTLANATLWILATFSYMCVCTICL